MPYKAGDYLAICDRCGFQRYASECKLDWQGWFVCADTCYEPKHEQFSPPKPKGESQSVPIRRAEDRYNFITGTKSPNDGYFITTPITSEDL